MYSLLLSNWAVLVGKKKRLQIDDLFSELCYLRRQGVVLSTEHFDLGLQVGQPLLLSLAAFKSSDTVPILVTNNK